MSKSRNCHHQLLAETVSPELGAHTIPLGREEPVSNFVHDMKCIRDGVVSRHADEGFGPVFYTAADVCVGGMSARD